MSLLQQPVAIIVAVVTIVSGDFTGAERTLKRAIKMDKRFADACVPSLDDNRPSL